MSALAFTLVVTLIMLVIVGVQDSTARVVRVMFASGALLVVAIFFSPQIAAILTPGGPALRPNGQILRDDSGLPLYRQDYITAYQGSQTGLAAVTYLGASLLAASILLLFYRLFIAGVDTARRPPIPQERAAKK